MTSPSPPLRKANNPDASNAFQPAGRAAFDLAFFTQAWRIKAFNTQPVGSLGEKKLRRATRYDESIF
ncbi:MAG: hypothetical protein ACLR17_03915 [Enterobacteriaceae bacterium]